MERISPRLSVADSILSNYSFMEQGKASIMNESQDKISEDVKVYKLS
jgi:hypothetical protein